MSWRFLSRGSSNNLKIQQETPLKSFPQSSNMTVIAQTALHNNTFGFLLRHLLAVKKKLISPCQAKPLLFTAYLWICNVYINQRSCNSLAFHLWSSSCHSCQFSFRIKLTWQNKKFADEILSTVSSVSSKTVVELKKKKRKTDHQPL